MGQEGRPPRPEGAHRPRGLPAGQQELLDLPGQPHHAAPLRVRHMDPVQTAGTNTTNILR